MPQARAVATRARIVEAAGSLFAEQGFEATSTTEIVDRAGVTKGALYFHFPTKALIAEAVMQQQTVAMRIPDAASPLQTVLDITYVYARQLQDDVMLRGAVRLSVDAATSLTPDLRAFSEPIELLSGLLVRARAEGQLLDTADPQDIAELITGCFTGTQVLSQVLSKREDLQQRLTRFWQTLLPGFAAPAAVAQLRLAMPEAPVQAD